jgi:excisionase family DNA binding protein
MVLVTEKEFFTVNEVATKMSVHRDTVLKWIDEGRLLSYRPGDRTIRIAKKDLDAFIELSRG